jgi:transcription termination factor Rho
MFNIETLRSKSLPELTKISKDLGVKIPKGSTKDEVVFAILDFQASNPKQTKEYYNATETNMEEKVEKPAVAKTTKAKPKAAPRKKVEKPAELSQETTEAKVEVAEPNKNQ